MKKEARESLDAYYREADSWATDRQDALRASRRVAWIIAAAAVVVAIFEALALVFLAPLKTVVPYTLMVDRNTGYVQALKPIDANTIAPDTAPFVGPRSKICRVITIILCSVCGQST